MGEQRCTVTTHAAAAPAAAAAAADAAADDGDIGNTVVTTNQHTAYACHIASYSAEIQLFVGVVSPRYSRAVTIMTSTI